MVKIKKIKYYVSWKRQDHTFAIINIFFYLHELYILARRLISARMAFPSKQNQIENKLQLKDIRVQFKNEMIFFLHRLEMNISLMLGDPLLN